jgi:hypothetical protein
VSLRLTVYKTTNHDVSYSHIQEFSVAAIFAEFLFMRDNMETHNLIEILNILLDCHPFAGSGIFDTYELAQIQPQPFPTKIVL